MEIMSSKHQHAALLCSPGMGHLIPVLELGKRLVTHQNFAVTIFVVPSHTSEAESQLLKSATSPNLCHIVQLPPPDISGLVAPDAAVVTILATMMREIRPAFRSSLQDMSFRPTVLIVDLFGTESLPIADELGIPKYVYVATNAWFISLMIYLPTLDVEVKGEYKDQKAPIQIPGCRELLPQVDVVDGMLDRTNQQYHEFVDLSGRVPTSDGIIANIWEELEPKTLAALRDENLGLGRITKVPVFPIGPLMRPEVTGPGSRGEVLDWLDKQPNESVMYVSFGSGGSLSYEQMSELAWGLEMSQQRFVWVVRTPTVTTADAAFFTAGNSGDGGGEDGPLRYLPRGFLDRTKDVGLVIPLWAPQVDILSHSAVGGFLSHCGWNSTLESLSNGVPMIAWPLYAEQRMNATLLTEELGVAVRSRVPHWEKVVEREEIEEMVRKIMEEKEGFAIRETARKLKSSAAKALEKGGSSHNALSQFAKHSQLCTQCGNGGSMHVAT